MKKSEAVGSRYGLTVQWIEEGRYWSAYMGGEGTPLPRIEVVQAPTLREVERTLRSLRKKANS